MICNTSYDNATHQLLVWSTQHNMTTTTSEATATQSHFHNGQTLRYTMAAIETLYNGVSYRSRLEARWAAMLDWLQVVFVYEPFDLDGWFPDFLLPTSTKSQSGSGGILAEVKPFTYAHQETFGRMLKATGKSSTLLMLKDCPSVITLQLPASAQQKQVTAIQIGWIRIPNVPFVLDAVLTQAVYCKSDPLIQSPQLKFAPSATCHQKQINYGIAALYNTRTADNTLSCQVTSNLLVAPYEHQHICDCINNEIIQNHQWNGINVDSTMVLDAWNQANNVARYSHRRLNQDGQ